MCRRTSVPTAATSRTASEPAIRQTSTVSRVVQMSLVWDHTPCALVSRWHGQQASGPHAPGDSHTRSDALVAREHVGKCAK